MALKARTGLFTPPGINSNARRYNPIDFFLFIFDLPIILLR